MDIPSSSEPSYEWPEGSLFENIYKMDYNELWSLVFGGLAPTKQEGEHFYKRTIEEIKLVGKCINCEQCIPVTKSMAEHISDFLYTLTRGLCHFEERYFPIEWKLSKNCGVQKEFTKKNPDGKHTVIVGVRLFQFQIVFKTTEPSLVAKYIPEKLEDNSKSSVFHNVNRFYQAFLESAVQSLYGYKLEWNIRMEKSDKDLECFESELSSKHVDSDRIAPGLNSDSHSCTISNLDGKRKTGQIMTKKVENKKRSRWDASNTVIEASCATGKLSHDQTFTIKQDVQAPENNMTDSLQLVKSLGSSLNFGKVREMLITLNNKKRMSVGDSPATQRTSNCQLPTLEKVENSTSITHSNSQLITTTGEKFPLPEYGNYINYSTETMNQLTVRIPKSSSDACRGVGKIKETEIRFTPISSGSARSSSSSSSNEPCLNTGCEDSKKYSPIDQLLFTPLTNASPNSAFSSDDGDEALYEPLHHSAEEERWNRDERHKKKTVLYYSKVLIASHHPPAPDAQAQQLNAGVTRIENTENNSKRFSFKMNPRKVFQAASVFTKAFDQQIDENDKDA